VGLQKCQHLEGEDLSELAAVTSGFSDDLEYMALGIESYFTAARSVAERVPADDFLHPIVAGKLNLDLLSTLLEG
jgi:hypothetical protein